MKRLVRDAVLIGCTAAAVWFVRGDATQESIPVQYNVPVEIGCNYGELRGVQVAENPMALTLRWSKDYPLVESLRGAGLFGECYIYPIFERPNT